MIRRPPRSTQSRSSAASDVYKRQGLTSGASAPEKLIQDFIAKVKKHCDLSIEEVVTTKEKVVFKLPRALN